jgi:hypothetical protein
MNANYPSAGSVPGSDRGISRLADELRTNPTTVPEFRDQLAATVSHLDGAGLGHVTRFGDVYLTMTGSVKETLGRFDDPERLEALTCSFGGFFFDALRGWVHDTRVAPAWSHYFSLADCSPHESGLHGIYDHIVNDLAQAAQAAGITPASAGDYFLVDENIAYASGDLTRRHIPAPRPVQWGVATLGARWAMNLRKDAWTDFLRLDAAERSDRPKEARAAVVEDIEQKALRATLRLARVGSVATRASNRWRSLPLSPYQKAA